MRISMIAAAAENNVIGKDNDLVWHIPSDFKYFKNKTQGHVIIMGRKTLESLGKPLKNRTNVVISRNPDLKIEGAHLFHDLFEAIKWSKEKEEEGEVFIIGGSSIYKQSMDLADRIYLTRVHESFEGDSYFPEIDDKWNLSSSDPQKADEKNQYDYTFEVYDKIV